MWRQPHAEMQGKTTYDRPLWLSPSPDLAHSGKFSTPGCRFSYFCGEKAETIAISLTPQMDKQALKNFH